MRPFSFVLAAIPDFLPGFRFLTIQLFSLMQSCVGICAGTRTMPRAQKIFQGKEGNMGILQAATPLILICTRDRVRASAFYREVLGLGFISEDKFAVVLDAGGIMLRVSMVVDFVAHEHSIVGFRVKDVSATVKTLRDKGVVFNIYPHFKQDELGIWNVPGGST